jgi:hypothetical protein
MSWLPVFSNSASVTNVDSYKFHRVVINISVPQVSHASSRISSFLLALRSIHSRIARYAIEHSLGLVLSSAPHCVEVLVSDPAKRDQLKNTSISDFLEASCDQITIASLICQGASLKSHSVFSDLSTSDLNCALTLSLQIAMSCWLICQLDVLSNFGLGAFARRSELFDTSSQQKKVRAVKLKDISITNVPQEGTMIIRLNVEAAATTICRFPIDQLPISSRHSIISRSLFASGEQQYPAYVLPSQKMVFVKGIWSAPLEDEDIHRAFSEFWLNTHNIHLLQTGLNDPSSCLVEVLFPYQDHTLIYPAYCLLAGPPLLTRPPTQDSQFPPELNAVQVAFRYILSILFLETHIASPQVFQADTGSEIDAPQRFEPGASFKTSPHSKLMETPSTESFSQKHASSTNSLVDQTTHSVAACSLAGTDSAPLVKCKSEGSKPSKPAKRSKISK